MNHSSLSGQLSVVPLPEQPRSRGFHVLLVLGSCSALLWVAPAFVRSLRTLVLGPPQGSVGSTLLEVSLTALALVGLAGLVFRGVAEARSSLRRLGRHRRWEQVLAEEELRDAECYRSFAQRAPSHPAGDARGLASEQGQARTRPFLRLVGADSWSRAVASSPQLRAPAGDTRLGFGQLSPAPAVIRGEARWVSEPQYITPYPFSVWSFHDNLPDPEWEDLSAARQPWVWLMLALMCVSLLAVFLAVRPLL